MVGQSLRIQRRAPARADWGDSAAHFQCFRVTLESTLLQRAARHPRAEALCPKSKFSSRERAARQVRDLRNRKCAILIDEISVAFAEAIQRAGGASAPALPGHLDVRGSV